MTDDIERAATETLPTATAHAAPASPHAIRVTIAKSIAICVPLFIAIFVGMVALALHNDHPDWNAYLAMAAGIGTIAGVFFGLLLGFTLTSHNFE